MPEQTPNENGIPKLDRRFIVEIQGKEFVLYAGLLDLAHQRGLQGITVEAIQYPTKDNEFEAICRATVESKTGEVFIELGDASPKNTNQKIVNHILRMAATRAKARCLRDFTNIGMTCLEELADFNEAPHAEFSPGPKDGNGSISDPEQPRPIPPASNPTNGAAKKFNQVKNEKPKKPSTAQLKAIESIAKRKNIDAESLCREQFNLALSEIHSFQASQLITALQQSA
jgi:hypothetical protein